MGEHEGRPYLELEYLEGGSLPQRLDGTPWPPRPAAELIATLASALEVMHGRGERRSAEASLPRHFQHACGGLSRKLLADRRQRRFTRAQPVQQAS
jgi:hypothetical protein